MPDSARIAELRRRVQVDPASIAFAALAEEYRRAGRFEDAVATCETGLLRHPAYLSARVTLGRALIELGRNEEAEHELEQVLRIAPENLAAIRGLAEIHKRRGNIPEEYVASQESSAEASPAASTEVMTASIETAPPDPEPCPEVAALPALESLLTAIVRGRRSVEPLEPSVPDPGPTASSSRTDPIDA